MSRTAITPERENISQMLYPMKAIRNAKTVSEVVVLLRNRNFLKHQVEKYPKNRPISELSRQFFRNIRIR
jgi:hypothetical protein